MADDEREKRIPSPGEDEDVEAHRNVPRNVPATDEGDDQRVP